MARKRRRIKDKWKLKTWLTVHAPRALGSVPIASIPSNSPESAIGRVVETTLFDIFKEDPSNYSIKLYFKIVKVDGNDAYTIFKGHEYAREYLRNLIRRGSSMVDYINNYTTRDGYKIRIFVVVFTRNRINSSRKHATRIAVHKILSERVPKLTYDQFIHEILVGDLKKFMLKEARKVCPIRHLGIRKTKLLEVPKGVEQIKPVVTKEEEAELPKEEAAEEETGTIPAQ